MSNPATYELTAHHFCTDTTGSTFETWPLDTDGGESGNYTLDVDNDLDVGKAFLCKTGNTGDMNQGGQIWLRYRVDTGSGYGGWTTVTTGTSYVRGYLSSGGADNDEYTTERLSSTARTFVLGRLEESDVKLTNSCGGGEDMEHCFSIVFRSADLSAGDTVQVKPVFWTNPDFVDYNFDGGYGGHGTWTIAAGASSPLDHLASWFNRFKQKILLRM
jgi:hypothetical protein